MSRRHAVLSTIAAGVALLLLAGCSSGSDAPKLDAEKSPLSKYFTAIYGDQDNDDYIKQAKKTEELVAACMSDEGFEYIPVDQSQFYNDAGSDSEFDYGSEEWVAENGYGMQQTQEQIDQQNEQSEEFTDPNQDYVMALSESEQAAYYEVLYGPGVPEGEESEDGSYEYDWESSGCYGAAQHETQGTQPWEDEKYKTLFDDINTMYEKMQKNPEIKKIDVDWAACMADKGETGFKAKQDASLSISDEMNEIYEANPTGELDQTADLEKLRKKEIALALVDFECSKKVDYEDRQLAVQFAAEEQFITDHKKQLDEIVADAKK